MARHTAKETLQCNSQAPWHITEKDGLFREGALAGRWRVPSACSVLCWADADLECDAALAGFRPGNSNTVHWSAHPVLARTPSGVWVEKFCWNPRTGVFLWVWPGQFHASAIAAWGQAPFDLYVRGIVLHGLRYIATRPLQAGFCNGLSGDPGLINIAVQLLCREIFSVPGWDWHLNATNPWLEAVTGRRGW